MFLLQIVSGCSSKQITDSTNIPPIAVPTNLKAEILSEKRVLLTW
jgi:hypothetical protein